MLGMDAIDQAIVRLLERHGRLSQEQLARRVQRLEAAGVLKGYRAVLDWAAVGLPLTAFVSVRTGGADCAGVGPALMGLGTEDGFVEECHRVTGDWCLLLKARAASPLVLQELIDRVRAVPGVQATMTTLALSSLHGTEEPT